MAKFIKSFFTPDKRKASGEGEEDGKDFTPPMDGRRNLSISRSGRMKPNKKRTSLTLVFNDEDLQTPTKAKSREYHVNNTQPKKEKTRRRSFDDSPTNSKVIADKKEDIERGANEVKTPEEEIELAFEIIDKVS